MSPNAPRTPHRTFRIPAELYEAARVKAAETDTSLSEVIRRLLEQWIKDGRVD